MMLSAHPNKNITVVGYRVYLDGVNYDVTSDRNEVNIVLAYDRKHIWSFDYKGLDNLIDCLVKLRAKVEMECEVYDD